MCVSSYSPVQPNNTEELRMWLALASPASPFQWPESNLPETTAETCGLPLSVSFAQLDQDIACSKMYPDSLGPEWNHNVWMTAQRDIFGTSTPFSETWPKQGIMLDGVCWEQTIAEAGTAEKGSGYMPTPTASRSQSASMEASKKEAERLHPKGQNHLAAQVASEMFPTPNTMDHLPCRSQEANERRFSTSRKGRTAPDNLREWIHPEMWPTPTSANAKQGPNIPDGKRGATLVSAVKRPDLWPTPSANEDAAGRPNGKMQKMLGNHPDIRGETEENWKEGSLNPDFVEWLMSWPIGWTSLDELKSDEILNPSIEPDIPRVTKKKENRAARLTAIGNGQFSLCVVAAWRLLTQ